MVWQTCIVDEIIRIEECKEIDTILRFLEGAINYSVQLKTRVSLKQSKEGYNKRPNTNTKDKRNILNIPMSSGDVCADYSQVMASNSEIRDFLL